MPGSGAGAGSNRDSVRRHNLSTLLGHLHRRGQLSRASLTTLMGLNRSTIGDLVAEVEDLGLVTQQPPEAGGRTAAGRPSVGVCAAERAYVLAVDVRVSGLVVARVGLGGRVLSQATGPPAAGHDPWATGSEIARLVRRSVRNAAPSSVLVGIGVSVPGIIARDVGVVRLAPNLDWHDVPLADLLADALPTSWRPLLGNDADHGALAEHLRGVGRGVDDLVYISGEVGVGAGVIAGGRPISGSSGFAGEIGHVPFGEGSKSCHCGAKGCWETEVGAATIAAAVGCPSGRLSDLGAHLDGMTSCPEELVTVGRHLGRGVAGMVNLLNPSLVILGGYLRSLYRWVEHDVHAEMAARALRIPGMTPRIALPALGDRPVLIGASEVAFRGLLDDPVGHMAAAPRTSELFAVGRAR